MENSDTLEDLIAKCLEEISEANRERCENDKADRNAALFLMTQIKLALTIEDVEFRFKFSKNEIERIQAEKYFELKNSFSDKKITEVALSNYVAKDKDVVIAKNECAKIEAEYKKWNYLLGILKDGHIYFRNSGKNKTWQE